MNSEQEIHQIELTSTENIDRSKYRVFHKPRKEGNREIFDNGQQYVRMSDGSLVRITDKPNVKSKKERSKERRLAKKKGQNEINS